MFKAFSCLQCVRLMKYRHETNKHRDEKDIVLGEVQQWLFFKSKVSIAHKSTHKITLFLF